MKRGTLKSITLAATLVVTGCAPLLDLLAPKPPGISNTTPTSPPTQAPSNVNPTPKATLPPDIQPTPPSNFTTLDAIALGFLVSNNAAGLKGSVSGPSTLVSNNAAGLVSNNAAGLVSNNAAGLVSNNAAGYRIATADDIKVAEGFVYLSTSDDRLYVDNNRKLFGVLTDADGNFDMPAPATSDIIVNVLLSGNRRLTAIATTQPGSKPQVQVNLATTLVTEFLRAKARDYGFTLADVFAKPSAMAILNEVTTLTTNLVKQDSVLASLKPSDLTINNIPVLRHRYVVAFGTGTDQALSDKWVAFFREMKNDQTSPDMVYRPLAITTVDTGGMIPVGNQVLSVGVGPQGAPNEGRIYVSHVSLNISEILELAPGGGSPRKLITKTRVGDDALRLPGTIEALANGKVAIMDTFNQWVGLMDPSPSADPALAPYFGFDNFDLWVNPYMLVDVYCGTTDGNCDGPSDATVDDIAFDDANPPNAYIADLNDHAVWKAADVFGRDNWAPLDLFAGTVGTANEEQSYSDLASLKFNQPAKVSFHKHGGTRYLYVTSNGDHVIVRINLDDPQDPVKKVLGQLPGLSTKYVRADGKRGPRKPLCYSPEEEGDLASKAHLRFPQKALFDAQGRMLVADADNRLIRLATVYDAEPRVWTIAGQPQKVNNPADCESAGLPPPFSNEDGEAKLVSLGEVSGMAMDPDGNLILSDTRSNRVRKLWTSFLK